MEALLDSKRESSGMNPCLVRKAVFCCPGIKEGTVVSNESKAAAPACFWVVAGWSRVAAGFTF